MEASRHYKGGRKLNSSHVLIDAVRSEFGIKTDCELSKAISYDRFMLSKIRNKLRPPSDEFILCVHEATEWPIPKIKELLANES